MLRIVGAMSLVCVVGIPGLYACGGDEFTAIPQTGGAGGVGGSGGDGGAATDGGGGAGGTLPECFDNDSDGVTDCEGDCDDTDPNSFPGNTEICGDGVDNDCDDTADQVDACPGGLGTYVSSLIGNDANDGTQLEPVATITEGIAHAVALGNGQAVFVAEGAYTDKVTLVEGVSLLGGYQCDTGSCTWARDFDTHVSDIQNMDDEGVFADLFVTNATRIDGFTITGLVSSGSNNFGITLAGATPIISNNKITSGNRSCGGCDSRAIWIQGPANDPITGVLIEDNEITAGDANDICHALQVSFAGAPRIQLHRNRIKGGACPRNRAVDIPNASFGTEIYDNELFAGQCTGTNNFHQSFALHIGGYGAIDGNRINHDPAETGTCELMDPARWCGGIEEGGITGSIPNNLIHGMIASARSAGIFMGEGEQAFGLVIINGNTIDPGGQVAGGAVRANISAAFSCTTSQGTNAVVGHIGNNILMGGEGLNRYGFYEPNQGGGRTCEPITYENNNIFFSTTVVGTDVVHRHYDGSTAYQWTLADLNMQTYATANIDTDPKIDPASYPHLLPISPCIDAGTTNNAPADDIDGDARPAGAGIDIGADEAG
jgi:hypothetical protein